MGLSLYTALALMPLFALAAPLSRHVVNGSPASVGARPVTATATATSFKTPAALTSTLATLAKIHVDYVMSDFHNASALTAHDILDEPTTTAAPSELPLSTNNTDTPTYRKKGNQLVMAYYPDWAGHTFPPEKISWERFDWIDFAFALPDEHYALTWDDPNTAPMLLKRLVTVAHVNGKKVKLSIGGWTGSK
jgi:hypothetical protein